MFKHHSSSLPFGGKTRRAITSALTVLFLSVGLSATSHASTFTVTSASDVTNANDGVLTLREAVQKAADNAGPDTVEFDSNVFASPQTITISTAFAHNAENLTVNGPAAGVTIKDSSTSPSGGIHGALDVRDYLTISNLTFMNCYTAVTAGGVKATKCSFYNGYLQINTPSADIDKCRFFYGARQLNGDETGNFTVRNSVFAYSSDVAIQAVTMTVDNSTIYGCVWGFRSFDSGVIKSCTIARCDLAGSIEYGTGGVSKSILAENGQENKITRFTLIDTEFGPTTEYDPIPPDGNGYGTSNDCGLDTGADGGARLALNGGGVETVALKATSPLIDTAGDSGFDTDQRGVARPQGAADDYGAFEYAPDTSPATVTVSTPTGSPRILPSAWVAGFAKGTASDNFGVASVSVKITKGTGSSRQYWNGTQFVPDVSSLDATLSNPRSENTNWSLDAIPTAGQMGIGSFTLTIAANDLAGNIPTNAATVNFSIVLELNNPAVTIAQPAAAANVPQNGLTAVNGTVTDDDKVSTLTAKLYRNIGSNPREYWNGSSFGTTSANAPITITGLNTKSVTWNLNGLPPAPLALGSYSVQVTAGDPSGNSGNAIRSFNVTSDTTPPVVTMAHPAAGNIAPDQLLVDGSATDNVAVHTVQIKLSRTLTNGTKEYWNDSAFTTTSANTTVTVTGTDSTSATWQLAAPPTAGLLTPGTYSVNVTVTDLDNNVGTATRSFTITNDTQAPTAVISHPTAAVMSISEFAASLVDGTASDNVGVASVALKLYRNVGTNPREYWNGTTFGSTNISLASSTTGLGTKSVTWSLAQKPSAPQLQFGVYGLQAFVTDLAGNSYTATKIFTVGTDITAPVLTIDGPTANQYLTPAAVNAQTIRGTVTDNVGTTAVYIKLFRRVLTTKQYWTGSELGSAPIQLSATLTGSDPTNRTWNLDTSAFAGTLPPGLYTVQVSARDAAGNGAVSADDDWIAPDQVARNFVLTESNKPTGVITNPPSGARLTPAQLSAYTIKGTASDDTEVDTMQVRYFSIAGGVKKYWDGERFRSLATYAPIQSGVFFENPAIKYWELLNPPTDADLVPGEYGIVLTIKDIFGNTSEPVTRNFTVIAETTAPSGSIDHPGNLTSISDVDFEAQAVHGTASDDTGVASVSVKLVRKNNGVKEYFNGTGWTTTSVAAPCTVTGAGGTNATWALNGIPDVSDIQGPYTLSVAIKDTSGNPTLLTHTVNILTDQRAPSITVFNPSANSNVSAQDFAFGGVSGVAVDDSGIQSVTVKLAFTANGIKSYWNGIQWQLNPPVALPARLTTFDAKTSLWELEKLAIGDVYPGAYTATITAVDPSGNKAILTVPFIVSSDQEKPVITLVAPLSGKSYPGSSLADDFINGTVTDNLGVASGAVKLYYTVTDSTTNVTTKYYWNGSEFTTSPVSVPMTLTGAAGNKAWTLSLPPASLDPRVYNLVITAKDVTGNVATNVTGSFTIIPDPVGGLRQRMERSSANTF